MASSHAWLDVLALVKTLFEATKASIDLGKTYAKYRNDRETQQESRRVSVVFSTFSEEEVQALADRLRGCRDRFVEQGSGTDRARCICSVLNEVVAANGGTLPAIDDWQNIYFQLGCARTAERSSRR